MQPLLTVHEFKQLVDHSLQETPMSTQKSRILTNHVHYVGSNDRLVILATLLLAQPKKLFDDCD